MPFESQLDEDQYRAVCAPEGPVLVLAGAGSGKTRVLTHRMIYLIQEKGYAPSEICALTFTNKAAKEMQGRIVQALKQQGISIVPQELSISTFHSTALRIIKDYRGMLGYSAEISIYDEQDQAHLVKEVCESLNLDPGSLDIKALASYFALAKESVFDALNEDNVHHFPIFERYQQKLKTHCALDFAQMLLGWYELLKHPEVGQQLKRRWRVVLVDEFQDTNKLQFEILKQLATSHRNLFVVGDEDQSIYRFRGAVLHNILNFDEIFPQAQIIKLRHNYRSTQSILKGAQAVVNHNKFRKVSKEMIALQDPGEPITLLSLISDIEEAREVVSQIGQWMLQGLDLRDIAVFYRTHSLSRIFEDTLRKFNIPYRVFGGMRFYDRAEIKDVLAYLRLILNPSDTLALMRILNVPPRGLGSVSQKQLEGYATKHNLALFEVIQSHLASVRLTARAYKSLERFRDLISKYQRWPGKSLSEMVLSLLQESGYQAYLAQDTSPEGQSRLENVQEFVSAVADYESVEAQPSLAAFLESLHLDADVAQLERGQDTYVSLMTCHAAKGLEFQRVFLVGCEEGIFPHILRDLSDPHELEEERRLFYVAMTRAKRHLCVSRAMQRKIMGFYQAQMPSRFIAEIPEEFTQLIDKTFPVFSSIGAPVCPSRSSLKNRGGAEYPGDVAYEYEAGEASVAEEVGHWIQHSTFGRGQIVAVEGEGDHKRYRIRFARYGEKRILASFASLSRLD